MNKLKTGELEKQNNLPEVMQWSESRNVLTYIAD